MTLRPARSRNADGPIEPAARLMLLSQAGELLAGSLDRRRIAALAAQIIVPRLADWVAFFPPSDHPNESEPEHIWHAEEDRLDALQAALKGWRPFPAAESAHGSSAAPVRNPWPAPAASPAG